MKYEYKSTVRIIERFSNTIEMEYDIETIVYKSKNKLRYYIVFQKQALTLWEYKLGSGRLTAFIEVAELDDCVI